MKYLKLFNNKNEYNSFVESEEFVLPNVSYCENDKVYYNAPKLIILKGDNYYPEVGQTMQTIYNWFVEQYGEFDYYNVVINLTEQVEELGLKRGYVYPSDSPWFYGESKDGYELPKELFEYLSSIRDGGGNINEVVSFTDRYVNIHHKLIYSNGEYFYPTPA